MSISNSQSIADLFWKRVDATPTGEAFQYPSGGGWKRLTWRETGEQVREIACGLKALGLSSENRCAILSSTRIDWILADLGVLCAGGVTTTIYPSSTPDDCAYILQDSGSEFVFAENDEQVAKLVEKRNELPRLKKVITFDGKEGHDGWVISMDTLKKEGQAYLQANAGKFEEDIKAIRREQLATLIYTSGTTGRPKGVELTHSNWLFEGETMANMNMIGPEDVQYLWLPLAHSFGKVLQMMHIRIGLSTAVDGRIDKIVENVAVIKPTLMAGVPRIFEKVYNRITTGAKEGGGLKYSIFKWAFKVGRQVSALRQKGQEPGGLLAFQYRLADKMVFSKIKDRFGGRVRFFISGGAPLSREIAEFFHAAGILILEGYGLTETSAASFVNRPNAYKLGSVGLPFEGVEVKIAPEDGEILLRGPNIMRGYHNLPEANKEVFDEEGWFRTGDIGELDRDGFLRITDRKKDLIKTSGGKYVAPQALEGRLKASCPQISQVLVHGNNRNFCTALITLDEENIKKWAQENGLGGASYQELTQNPQVKAFIQTYVDQLNSKLASYETIKKFAILPQDFSEKSGELTASLKMRRKIIEQKNKAILDSFYEGALAS